MKSFFTILLISFPLWSYSQLTNIVAAEYFFDSDPGIGGATALPAFTANSNLDVTFLAASSGLSEGMHILGIRVQDNTTIWSIPLFLPVYVLANNPILTGAEYFFDTDPGFGNATPISITAGATIDVTFAANSAALGVGMHVLVVRTRGPNGDWGMPAYTPFYIDQSRTITKLEYFFDTDPGSGNGTAIAVNPATDVLDQVYSMNSSALAIGSHNLNVRVAGQNNFWSMPESFSFSVTAAPLPTITSFNPTSGPIGTIVTITGTNFSATPANNIVFFGATQAAVTAATPTQLTVTVPAGATYQPITVSAGGLTAHAPRPFVVSFAGGGVIDNCSFAPATVVGIVSTFNRSALFDVDGDGKTDLLVPDRFNNQISVFRNTSIVGTSSFAPAINVTGLNEPVSVALGDVDSDGNADMAVVNYTNGKLSVYKNISTSGTISFAAKVDFTIPAFSHDVTIADVDGDGKQDLTLITSLNGLIVFRNTGTPGVIDASTFASGVTFATGPNAFPTVLGDIDGDGKLDAAVPNANAYTVSVLRNTSTPGAISFATQTLTIAAGTPSLGFGAGTTLLGDIDGDTKLDLLVTVNTLNTVSIYRNTSALGSISFDPKFDIAFPATSYVPAISDLDGDGKIDLVIDRNTTGLSIYKNTATSGVINASSFATPVILTRSASGSNLIGDVDGDGRNDVLSTFTNIQVFRNLIGTISPPTITSFSPPIGPVGNLVIINGTNFSTPFSSDVKFNGTTAAILGNTGSTIQTEVPVGATTGPIQLTIGCNSVTSSSNFTIGVPATITITTQPVNFSFCFGQTPIAAFTTTATGTTNITYQWQSQQVDFTFDDVVDGGAYSGANTPTLSVNTGIGIVSLAYRCRINGDFASQQISNTASLLAVFPPPAPATTGANRCGAGSLTLTGSGAPNGQYRWYDVPTGGTALSGEINNSFITPSLTATTTYYVSANNGSCESTRTAVIATILSLPSKPAITSSEPINAGIVELCLNAITLSAPSGFSYSWSNGETTQQITNVQPGNYSVVIKDASGCSSISSDVIQVVANTSCVNSAPVINTTTVITTIGGFVSIDLSDLISDPDDNLDPASLQVVGNTTQRGGKTTLSGFNLDIDYSGTNFSGDDLITIRICDQLGVCIEKQFAIEVIGDINVYNGVSPNGDNKNDTWIIEYIDLFPDTQTNRVTLYNRWGDVVWEASNYDNNSVVFSGINKNGSELSTGSYFYKIEFSGGRKTKSGYLSLKR